MNRASHRPGRLRITAACSALALVGLVGARSAGASPAPCSGEGCEAWVATYDGPAHQLDTPRNLSYAVPTLALSPDGRTAFVTGTSFGGFPDEGGSHYDYVTIAYDAATGEQLWAARYAGPGNSQDSAWALGVSPDGRRVFVTGMSIGRTDQVDWDYATVAYDAATGDQLWVARYDVSLVDRAWALGVSPDGSTVYVSGDSRNGAAVTSDYVTIAYDAATGAERWTARYDGPGHGRDDVRWLAVAPDGSRVFVTGRSTGDGTNYDYATIAYDPATGAERWVARYNGPRGTWDEATAVTATASRIFVTGESEGIGTSGDYATLAYDAATGTQQWVARYDGPATSLDFALAVAASHDGERLLVTGYSIGEGTSYDYGTVAYDAASGTQQWVARYNGPPGNNSDNAYAVAFSADDALIYVTGESPNDTHYDIATVAYDASNGFTRGVARYNGPENFQDGAFSIAVAPDGSRVYVNGETWHSTSPGVGDYATIAYNASALSGLGASGVEIDVTDDDVSVRGTAFFGGQGPVAIGQDPAGDALGGAAASAAGLDLRGLAVSQPDAEDPTLAFALDLEGLGGGGIPEGVLYSWGLRVAGETGGWYLETARSRAAATGTTEPWAALFACPTADPCTERTRLTASYDEESARITVRLPIAAIGAGPGSTIEPWSRDGEPVEVLVSPAGLATAPQTIDVATPQAYGVPSKAVSLGIAPRGTPAGQVEFATAATLTANDGVTTFDGTVSHVGLSGAADVWIKVCFGLLCSSSSIQVDLP